jgi:hypothetical protein
VRAASGAPVGEEIRIERDAPDEPDPQLLDLTGRHCGLWWQTPCEIPRPGPRVPAQAQRENARASERLIEELADAVLDYPESEPDRLRWRRTLEARVRQFGAERLGWPDAYQSLLFADAFLETTRDFVRESRAFAPAVRVDDVTQALRNVWIANSLQLLLDRPVRLTPSLFGYSMLYPWTDNYLDDPHTPSEAKRAFNRALTRRLAGRACAPADRRQAEVFELVARVESEHPRAERPQVYASLLAIQWAQAASLAQQRAAAPYEVDLLALSLAKGGASVLADAWLVAGALQPDEIEFAFGYGVFLQLLDDLQDVQADAEAGHATLFSQAAGRWPLDGLAARLYAFIARVVDGSPRFRAARHDAVRDLIRRNCTLLLVGAVAEHADLFSSGFVAALEECWPVDFAALRRLRRRAARRYAQTAGRLCRARGVRELIELVA